LYSHVSIYPNFEVYKYVITIYSYVCGYKQRDLLVMADSDWACSSESVVEMASEKESEDLVKSMNGSEDDISEHSNNNDVPPSEPSVPLPVATSSIRRGLELLCDVPGKPHGLAREDDRERE